MLFYSQDEYSLIVLKHLIFLTVFVIKLYFWDSFHQETIIDAGKNNSDLLYWPFFYQLAVSRNKAFSLYVAR